MHPTAATWLVCHPANLTSPFHDVSSAHFDQGTLMLPLQALISTAPPSQKCQQNTAKKFQATTGACQLCTFSVIFPRDQKREKLPSYRQKENQRAQLDVSAQEALRCVLSWGPHDSILLLHAAHDAQRQPPLLCSQNHDVF